MTQNMPKLTKDENAALLKLVAHHIRKNDADAVKGALDQGADVSAQFYDGEMNSVVTVMHVAAKADSNKAIFNALARAAQRVGSNVDAPDKNGDTALGVASANYKSTAAHNLISCGASPVALNKGGKTPIDHALSLNNHDYKDRILKSMAVGRADDEFARAFDNDAQQKDGDKNEFAESVRDVTTPAAPDTASDSGAKTVTLMRPIVLVNKSDKGGPTGFNLN